MPPGASLSHAEGGYAGAPSSGTLARSGAVAGRLAASLAVPPLQAFAANGATHMAKTRTPLSEAVSQWQTRVGQSGQRYTSGVQRATGWAAATVAAGPRRDAGLQAAIADGRIDAGVTRVGDAGWKSRTLAVGQTNWTAAVAKAGDRMAAGLQKVYGFLDAAAAATASIDTTTIEGRLEKARVHAMTMHQQANAAKAGR